MNRAQFWRIPPAGRVHQRARAGRPPQSTWCTRRAKPHDHEKEGDDLVESGDITHGRQIPVVDRPVDVRVLLRWRAAGPVVLDGAGKLSFGPLERLPSLYRLTLTAAGQRPQVYVGETDNLRRRLATNYRNPGPSQQTSKRINRILLDHLGQGAAVRLAVGTTVTVWINTAATDLDLSRKACRLLAENAALVELRATDDADIINLG